VFRVAATAADFPSGKAEPTRLGNDPIRRRQRRMRGNLPGPEGLARHFARAQPLYLAVPADLCAGPSAALHGLPVVTTTGRAARLASAPSPCQRGSREILRQAPKLLDMAAMLRQNAAPTNIRPNPSCTSPPIP